MLIDLGVNIKSYFTGTHRVAVAPGGPGEEGVDDAPVSPAAGQGHPEQTESPASLAGSVVELGFSPVIGRKVVSPVDQEQPQQTGKNPEDHGQTSV